jgi:hypothetical protein
VEQEERPLRGVVDRQELGARLGEERRAVGDGLDVDLQAADLDPGRARPGEFAGRPEPGEGRDGHEEGADQHERREEGQDPEGDLDAEGHGGITPRGGRARVARPTPRTRW